MAHLLKIRKGWENETLAKFILSKFSFISRPSTVADDVGADFFCTFFFKISKDRKTKNNRMVKDVFIYPKHSFAIQIKSSRRQINLTNKLEFFDNLETPFFIGVVNQKKLSMTIYSGDVIPELFSLVGLPTSNKDITVRAAFLDERKDHGQQPRQTKYTVPFFKIGEICAGDTEEKVKAFVEEFSELCLNYQRNIISKKKHQYIFHDAVTLEPKIIFGSGSYQVCRNNFIERLAEVICNLAWAAPQIRDKDKKLFLKEYDLYKQLYFDVTKFYGEGVFLKGCFERMEGAVRQI
ncbi:MAG: hypothetical protein SWH78_06900 [Thermodesulfobacteriota bacterium]|nr:hypothetical protein [Thermodesulfobacteriota bacterium]